MLDRLGKETTALLVLAAILLAGAAYAAYRTVRASHMTIRPAITFESVPKPDEPAKGSWPALENADFFEKTKDSFLVAQASFIEADLTAMKLTVYKNGEAVKEVPILSKGREGSWWETPAGLYRIETKERNHFSSFGKVYQPWSMVFQGNFFIHGWPYYPDGTPVASTYSGGCIRLSTEDAKAVYALAEKGMPVLVYQKEFAMDDFAYIPKEFTAGVTSTGYLAADLKNNFVFDQKNLSSAVPIASLTKLMTALIAAEYINLDKEITVPPQAIVYTSKPRLRPGEKVSAYQLLYPLLQESSNEAALTLATALGKDRFVGLMNQKAAALGMLNTRFTDPSGADAGNVSTPEDLFLLAKYLMNNRSFILKITAGTLGPNVYGPSEYPDLKNFNVFNGQPDFLGGKVGMTNEAGETMLAIFNENLAGTTRPVAIITLGSASSSADVAKIKEDVVSAYQ